MTPQLSCASGIEQLMDYLEDVLPLERRAELEAHLAGCARCVAFVGSYRETPGVLRRATLAVPPPELARSVLEFLRRRR